MKGFVMRKKGCVQKNKENIRKKPTKSQKKIDWFDSLLKECVTIEDRLKNASLFELEHLLKEAETKLLFIKNKINPYPEDGLSGSLATKWEGKIFLEKMACESEISFIKSKIEEKQR